MSGILPWLTPLAAVGCALLMIAAAIAHRRRGEGIMVQIVLLLLSLVVIVGRFSLLA